MTSLIAHVYDDKKLIMEIRAAVRDDVSVIAGFIREQAERKNSHSINEEGIFEFLCK